MRSINRASNKKYKEQCRETMFSSNQVGKWLLLHPTVAEHAARELGVNWRYVTYNYVSPSIYLWTIWDTVFLQWRHQRDMLAIWWHTLEPLDQHCASVGKSSGIGFPLGTDCPWSLPLIVMTSLIPRPNRPLMAMREVGHHSGRSRILVQVTIYRKLRIGRS